MIHFVSSLAEKKTELNPDADSHRAPSIVSELDYFRLSLRTVTATVRMFDVHFLPLLPNLFYWN